MGNDGGSIPTRRELVKESAKPKTLTDVKEKQREHLAHRWSQCPLSHTALKKPVVSDYAGDLYNKDAIIQFLLPDEVSNIDKAEATDFLAGRVKSLKDVVEVIFESEHDDKDNADKWICPVTGKELGAAVKAVYLVPCGHAFSHEAIKQMKSNECVQCSQTYESDRDVIPILPVTENDKHFVMERIGKLKELGLAHSLKKDKGGKKRKAKDALNGENNASAAIPVDKSKKHSSQPSGLKNSATADLTARVLTEEANKKQKRQTETDNIQSLYNKSNGHQTNRNADFMTRGFSIPTATRQG